MSQSARRLPAGVQVAAQSGVSVAIPDWPRCRHVGPDRLSPTQTDDATPQLDHESPQQPSDNSALTRDDDDSWTCQRDLGAQLSDDGSGHHSC